MTWKLFSLLLEASLMTIFVSALSILLGLAFAIVLSGMRMSGNRALFRGAGLFISFFRGVPLLVQLLLIYNFLPAVGITLPSLATAIIGLSLCTAAYQAENLRGGFEGVPPGLVESAEMAGFSRLQTFVHIRTPIALRMTFPALVNEAILILKASSLVSVVGLIELTKMAQNLAASTYMPLPIFASAGLIYLVINLVVAFVGNRAENALPGLPSK
ncbi:MAG: amino acid ABC transporter permease [Rhodobacteraceae bacterium]|jgi:polar amino acid transport system permease protein|uniref:Amino acid ABC transporter membrane protein 1, PAAT family n=1 Tax=Salipiger profundus TaxID=1229727 RepID=A0A1U7D4C2_9RHOB|nr:MULTISPECIES: amino acid ABC transporter permease [Salipiger]APX23001.1 amino acid ABC transporter membrane protein 1, PAAT family [Salipiger profundus]MAB04664.1 amino acid ABC transporter permease [Paracoccaceae bacterium]GGA12599.1 amino acid ABC transporter [Salipiger profundus]SFD21674.1 amino acid ABC transporter membrane protein 1, PAAT family [Salipiger profundus]